MAQSIYSDPKYLEFSKYTKRLEKEINTYDKDKREKHIANWLRGRKVMEQLALKYGMDLTAPYPIFARKDEIDNIEWVKSKDPDGNEIVWGLWTGEDHVKIDGKHVFNESYLDFLTHGYKDKDKAKKMMAKLMVKFDGEEEI